MILNNYEHRKGFAFSAESFFAVREPVSAAKTQLCYAAREPSVQQKRSFAMLPGTCQHSKSADLPERMPFRAAESPHNKNL